MLRNYLTIAIRHLMRHKVYTAINVMGLALGIAFCLLTFLFVRHEWTYDQFHKDADRIYRVVALGELAGGPRTENAGLSNQVGQFLKTDLPQLSSVVRIRNGKKATLALDGKHFEDDVVFVDEDFFSLFTFPLIQGDPKTVLGEPDAVVLTRNAARKYFGEGDPLGREISIAHLTWKSEEKTFVVRGIAENPPENSSIQFQVVIPHSAIPPPTSIVGVRIDDSGQTHRTTAASLPVFMAGIYVTYVRLADGVQMEDVGAALDAFVEAHRGNRKQDIRLHLQPISEVHFDRRVFGGLSTPGNPVYSYILTGIACSVLLIGCVNFMNLSVARSAMRAREVGVRKVVGASRFQLMRQFWGESLLLSSAAFVLGFALAEFFLPIFNRLTQVTLTLDYGSTASMALFGAGIVLLIGLVSGVYPAVILSGVDPVAAMKDRLRIGGKSHLGRLLVVGQFAVAAIFLSVTMVMSRQLAFLKSKDLGLNEAQVVVIKTGGLKFTNDPQQALQREQKMKTFKEEIKRYAHVAGVTQSDMFSAYLFAQKDDRRQTITLSNGAEISLVSVRVDEDFLPALGIEVVAGRNFSMDFGTDETDAVVVNETLIKAAQLDNPLGAYLKMRSFSVSIRLSDGISNPRVVRIENPNIIGVVKDFHVRSLYYEMPPLVMFFGPGKTGSDFLVRIRPERMAETLAFIAGQWQAIMGDAPFDYVFLDENFGRLYQREERWGQIVQYASFFALFVSCLGVLGLTALAVTRRTKEIGIRKVFGASGGHIVALISRDFLFLILMANLIAWPVAYYAADLWLREFAYRIDLSIGLFLLGGALVLLTALLTSGIQAWYAARRNPIDALRYE